MDGQGSGGCGRLADGYGRGAPGGVCASLGDDGFKGVGHFAGGLEAFLAFLGHGAGDQVFAGGGEVGFNGQDARHRVNQVLHGDAHRGGSFVGQLAGQHLEQDGAQGVDVAAVVNIGIAAGLFGTHVGGGADQGVAGQGDTGFGQAGDAKI